VIALEFEKRAVVNFRHAPLFIMIRDVERIVVQPPATFQPVGVLNDHSRASLWPSPSDTCVSWLKGMAHRVGHLREIVLMGYHYIYR
jgi:hypothetical protein